MTSIDTTDRTPPRAAIDGEQDRQPASATLIDRAEHRCTDACGRSPASQDRDTLWASILKQCPGNTYPLLREPPVSESLRRPDMKPQPSPSTNAERLEQVPESQDGLRRYRFPVPAATGWSTPPVDVQRHPLSDATRARIQDELRRYRHLPSPMPGNPPASVNRPRHPDLAALLRVFVDRFTHDDS